MKSTSVLLLISLFLSFTNQDELMNLYMEDSSIKESLLTNSINVSESSIQVIECKTIIIPEDEQIQSQKAFGDISDFVNNPQIYYSEGGSFFRMYIPLANAIMLVNSKDTLFAYSIC